ncbi:MAG: phosphoenolpyruvate--protein phosphotransferase [Enterococcus sp.]|nr:phosphoenolpyruvate--protein phosphotransferase [Enterococcus sp.]
MKQGSGTSVMAGIAIGPVCVIKNVDVSDSVSSGDPEKEKNLLNSSIYLAKEQISKLADQTREKLGDEHAQIMEVQIFMLEDQDYVNSIYSKIDSGMSAAQATKQTGEEFATEFASMDDDYMRARATDVKDVSGRLAALIVGGNNEIVLDEPSIIVSKDLTPSQTAQLDKDMVLSIVIEQGSTNSHTAILARSMGIPALVQTDIVADTVNDKELMAVDAVVGKYYLDPDETTIASINEKKAIIDKDIAALEDFRGKESVTTDGRKIHLMANIGSAEDAKKAIADDAEGSGLLRSEFLYLGRTTNPTEDELFEAYKEIFEIFGDKPVVVRTIDIGADKQVDYLDLDNEENPALGIRGLRLCLENPELFKISLRAIYRASAFGNPSIMFPMVANIWEIKEAKDICRQVREELAAQGKEFKEVPIGIMIETPAAAVIADKLAKEVDFFSVGTNDLVQYTCAVDRQNSKAEKYREDRHPAVMELMRITAKAATDNGIWAGICGELGANTNLTGEFIDMGFTELSMASSQILAVRKVVCEH